VARKSFKESTGGSRSQPEEFCPSREHVMFTSPEGGVTACEDILVASDCQNLSQNSLNDILSFDGRDEDMTGRPIGT
jgi:hypothetical protein